MIVLALALALGAAKPAPAPAAPPAAAPAAAQDAVAEEDLPTIDGEEILEELPAEDGLAAPAASLDFEPLVVPTVAAAPAPAAIVPPAAAVAPPTAAIVPPAPPPVPPPAPAAAAPREPALVPPPPPPAVERVIAGVHRVVVHTVEGQVRRGVLEDVDLAAASFGLSAQPGGAPELVGAEKVKAIFFMLAPGEKAPAPEGKKVRVTFRDGRQIAGFSPEYDDTGPGFFVIPADTRTNTGRIWVYRAAVKQVAVS